MLNPFYTFLTNDTPQSLSSLRNTDMIPADFVPVSRHTIVDDLMRLAFTVNKQHQQRLISLARMSIIKGQLSSVLRHSVDGGFKVDEIERSYQVLNAPTTDNGVVLPFSGRPRSAYFNILRINVALDEGQALIQDGSGSPYTATSGVSDSGVSISFTNGDCTLFVPTAVLPAGINWSSFPDNMLQSFADNVGVIKQLLLRYSAVQTTLSEDTVKTLVDAAIGEVSTYSLAVIAILVATHTAKAAGLSDL